MKLIEYAPYVAKCVAEAGWITQTDLTVAVWGTSGRGNTSLKQILFPWMVERGYLEMRKFGRAKMFAVTEKGTEYARLWKD